MQLATLLAAVVLPALASAQEPVDLAITNVTVIDPASRSVLSRSTVTVLAGRIDSVEPYDKRAPPLARRTLAGRGGFLVPGLLDMHVHLALEETRETMDVTLDLLLANGVTGVRDMAADCWEPKEENAVCMADLRRLAEAIDSGERLAPRFLSLSSAIIRGEMERGRLPEGAPGYFAPGSAEEGRELARYLQRRGVDLAKVYNSVPNDAYFALMAEASDQGLEVSGHLPLGISVLEASNAGQRTIEHARDLPLACSGYGASYRQTMRRVVEGDISAEPPDAETRLRETLAGYDEALCRKVIEVVAANGTYLVPTHGTREMDARAAERAYRNDKRWRTVPPLLRKKWQSDLDETAKVAPLLGDLYLEFYDLGLRLTGMAQRAGVRVMVGTDANDTMIFPGSGLHEELERLSQAGIAPMEILRAATSVPAEYLGRSEELGSIAPGWLADFVLLRANPLEDIVHTRKIRAVVLGGRVLERSDLDSRLERVERAVKERDARAR